MPFLNPLQPSGRSTWHDQVLLATRPTFLLAGLLAFGSLAYAQNTMPDAQVESNVLKALASAPELASDAITTRTVYGTVTLTGSVHDEAARRRAENLAANADGVKKVVDELQLGTADASNQQPGPNQPMYQPDQAPAQQGPAMVLQSDGTYAPAPAAQADLSHPAPGSAPATMAQRNDPDNDQQLDQQRDQQQGTQPNQQQQSDNSMPPQGPPMQQGQPNNTADNSTQPYPNRRPLNPYPGYPQQQQPNYPPNYQQAPGYADNSRPVYGGQAAGQPVTIPAGAMLRIRINRTLSSNHTPAGTTFDGIVTNDVVADGFVAIPRGAAVQGTVIDAKSSGVLKGRGEMSVQLTSVSLGGKVYPIASDVWAHNGADKTIETVNKTAGFGAAGALLGALAGGGRGAAIGGGVGAAAGLGSSAASGNGQVFIPAEGVLTFHIAQPTQVQTVSEQEMQRLAYGVAPGADGRYPPRRVYVQPGYYPYGPYYGPRY